MADREHLDEAIQDLSILIPEEVIEKYKQTTFKTPSRLERSVEGFVKNDDIAFRINEYAQFLDEGTRFITKQPFITPVLADDNNLIQDTLAIGFENDIYEAIDNTATEGGGKLS